MPQLKLNEHIHWLIVEKSLKGFSHRVIAEQLNISKSLVFRVFLKFQKYGYVENLLPSLRRSRILKVNDIKYLESLLKEKVD